MTFLEEDIWGNLGYLGFGNGVLDTMPKARPMEEKIDTFDFIKVKNFFFLIDIEREREAETHEGDWEVQISN